MRVPVSLFNALIKNQTTNGQGSKRSGRLLSQNGKVLESEMWVVRCFFLVVSIALSLIPIQGLAQEEGVLSGSRQFEESENRVLGKHVLEERYAIQFLEKELAYRKARLEMLELGARNRGISFADENPLDSLEEGWPQKMLVESNDELNWRVFLGRDTDRLLKNFRRTAIGWLLAKRQLYLMQLERLDSALHLAEQRLGKAKVAWSKAPISDARKEQVLGELRSCVQAIKKLRSQKTVELEEIQSANFDLSTISEDALFRSEKKGFEKKPAGN